MRWANHILRVVMVSFMASILLVACTKDMSIPQEQHMMLQVNLDVDDATKAIPTEQEKSINSVRIYAYRKDTGSFVGYFYSASVSSAPIFMDLVLPQTGKYDVVFYVFANEESVNFSDGFTFSRMLSMDQLKSVRFHSMNQGGTLPLYCIHEEEIDADRTSNELNDAEDHRDHYFLVQKVTFRLMRPLAKLSVYAAMAPGTTTAKVHAVSFLKGGSRQHIYVLPVDSTTLASVPSRAVGRDLLTEERSLTRIAPKGSKNPEDYDLLTTDDYIPETEVGSDKWEEKVDERQAAIHIQYSVGDDGVLRHGYVYLPAIQRNTHYKIYISLTSEGRIILNYKVAPWNSADMTDIWFDYPTHSFLEAIPGGGVIPSKAVMSATMPFVGYFRMSYPESEKWRPMILNGASEKVSVKVYRNAEVIEPPIAADSDNWYKIEVSPVTGLEAGDEVELSIIYSPTGSPAGEYEYLLINGSQNNYHWPESLDANKVTITVI